MMPTVESVPMQSVAARRLPDASASGTGTGGPEIRSDHFKGRNGTEFGSAMTAALADASQQDAAKSVRPSRKSAADTSKPAAQDAGTGAQRKEVAGCKVEDVRAAQAASANITVTDAENVKARASMKPTDGGERSASHSMPLVELASSPAAAKVAFPGLPVEGAAAQHSAGANGGTQTPDARSTGDVAADPAAQLDAHANTATKPDAKKVDAKNSVAGAVVIAPNAMVLSQASAVVSAPAPATPTKMATSRVSAKVGGDAVAVMNRQDAVKTAGIAAKIVAGAMLRTGVNADAGASGVQAGANTERSIDDKSKAALSSTAVGAESNRASLNPAVDVTANANPVTGAQPATSASGDAQHAAAQGAQSATTPSAKNAPTNSVGISSGAGFTAALLNGHPGTAQAAMQPQAHAAAASSNMGAANPYARMDETHAPSLVYASPQKMSVVVSDPSLGNFQVRAQSAGALVAASLATASAVTHAQLSGQLPSLTIFLQEQQVNLPRVTVVQQSLLGGDGGARGFNGEQQGRSGSSRSRGARTQQGRIEALGSATGVNIVNSTVAANTGDATASVARPQGGLGSAMSYVDVLA